MAQFIGSKQIYARDVYAVEKELSTGDISKTVGIASTLLARNNPARKYLVVVNIGTYNVFLGLGYVPTITTGILLQAGGGSYIVDDLNPHFGEILAIADGGSSVVVGMESYYG